jgi:hypothetical protein
VSSARKTIVLAPHDDGGGAFAVLWRIARALVHVADDHATALDIYVLNSSAADHGQARVNELARGSRQTHRALYVPTDNLIRLPKDPTTAGVDGARIPDVLRNSVRPRWHEWPSEPNRVRAELWTRVDLGLSNGVPQLHRLARRYGFPSIEAGDWFFSVGLRGCMEDSGVPPEVIASTEDDLRMIEADEFKAPEAWFAPYLAPVKIYTDHLANSAVRMRIMNGLLWSGDPVPAEGIVSWGAAQALRREIDRHLAAVRGLTADAVGRVRVVFIVGGATGVWSAIVEKVKAQERRETSAAVVDLDRHRASIALLERNGGEFVSEALQQLSGEERHLATCRASDCGVTRSAGGVLGFAATRRPVVLVDEPGHWLGRIQREQCLEAGICGTLQLGELLDDPHAAIQKKADTLARNSSLDEMARAAEKLPVGAEHDLATYLWKTYLSRVSE